jgi:ethanolamine permease
VFQGFLYNCMLIVALVNYITQLSSFIILRTRYSLLTRAYYSPFGVPGALLAMCVFALTIVGVFVSSGTEVLWSILAIAVYLLLGVAYYVLYSRHNLILSPEEQVAMFMVRRGGSARRRSQMRGCNADRS